MKVITTKYHGPSHVKGARISASDGDTRVYISYPHELSGVECHKQAVLKLVCELGWKGSMVFGGNKDGGYTFVFLPSFLEELVWSALPDTDEVLHFDFSQIYERGY